jgi:opacity protein-like surface antigen
MFKQVIGAAVAALTLAVAPAAFAGDWYVRGELGASVGGNVDVSGVREFDLDSGLVVSGALGADFGSGVRVEGEIVYLDNDVDIPGASADVQVTGLFANVAYDFASGGGFTPYVGAGIGWANTEHSNPLTRDDDTNFAWQLKGGVAWDIAPNTALDVNYRYLNAPEFSGSRIGGGPSVEADTDAHVLSVGVRYTFAM